MYKNVKILDCTLRDGGYVNDWNFSHSVITGTYKRLDSAGIDFIEVGFLDDRHCFDIDKSIVPTTDGINEIFKNVKKQHAIPVAMIDFGTCSLDNIKDCDSTFIEGIRVIFKKEKIDQALPYCKKIKEKGYKLFIQAISITSYSDSEMLDYIKKINEIKPYAFSIVDTYGLLDIKSMTRYFYLIDNNLDKNIKLGYHEHNNFQLGFSNTMHFLAMETDRELIADSTVYGMGKSAGNCPSELLAMYLNEYYNKNYDLNQILEIIDTDLITIYQKKYWGYRYDFYISAMQACHPSYVKYLLDKKTLSISAVNSVLQKLPKEEKLIYNKQLIEELYIAYQAYKIDDSKVYEILKAKNILNNNIIVLGPGPTLKTEQDLIKEYVKMPNTLVFSVNFFLEGYDIDFVFMSNAKRYAKFADILQNNNLKADLILTSNITPIDYKPDYMLNYESLLYQNERCSDNSLLLLLNFLIKLGVKNVKLAGFDGFDKNTHNYFEYKYEFAKNDKEDYDNYNIIIKRALSLLNKDIQLDFITKSKYKD